MENIGNINAETIYYDVNVEEFMKLAKGNNFFHGRLNDGEFNSIMTINNPMNSNSANCDGHLYYYQLGVDLKRVLLEYEYSNNYIISGGKNYFDDYKNMFIEIYIKNPKLKMQNGYFYYELLMNPKYFEEFNEFLNQKKVVIIGPSYMKDIKLFNNFEIIEIPRYNCYQNMDLVNIKISELNAGGENINYCFVAGMMSSVIIHKFFWEDKKNSYYNIGSAWDYFFQSGKYSVIHHRQIYYRLINEFNKYYSKYIVL